MLRLNGLQVKLGAILQGRVKLITIEQVVNSPSKTIMQCDVEAVGAYASLLGVHACKE